VLDGELPETIILRRHGRGLRLQSGCGTGVEIDARLLRARCRCSGCLRASWVDSRPEDLEPDVRILELRQLGSTGLQVVFSDGHERGIYPWSYLWAIANAALDRQDNAAPIAE
jgi:DUF971 family protein